MTNLYLIDLFPKGSKNKLSIHHINWWLMKYEDEFYNAIPKSECRKWSKWIDDNSIHIFPCVCPTREQDCIFIELYFELLKVSELEEQEIYFGKIMEEYCQVQSEEFTLELWMEKYKTTWMNSHIDEVIKVKLTTEPYTCIEVQLNRDEFRNIFTFQKTFSRLHFSKEV